MKPIQEMGSEQKRLTGLTLVLKYFIYLLNILSDLFFEEQHGVVTGSEVRVGPSGRRLDERAFPWCEDEGHRGPCLLHRTVEGGWDFPERAFFRPPGSGADAADITPGGRKVVGAGPQEALFMRLARLCSLETEWTRVTSRRSQCLPGSSQLWSS